jgi:hypothetical protein
MARKSQGKPLDKSPSIPEFMIRIEIEPQPTLSAAVLRFGVARSATLRPNRDPGSRLARRRAF